MAKEPVGFSRSFFTQKLMKRMLKIGHQHAAFLRSHRFGVGAARSRNLCFAHVHAERCDDARGARQTTQRPSSHLGGGATAASSAARVLLLLMFEQVAQLQRDAFTAAAAIDVRGHRCFSISIRIRSQHARLDDFCLFAVEPVMRRREMLFERSITRKHTPAHQTLNLSKPIHFAAVRVSFTRRKGNRKR